MSEAQKVLIERCGWACERSLRLALEHERRGLHQGAAMHYESAELSSRLAFDIAQAVQA